MKILRKQALVPLFMVIAATGLYFGLLFDLHLRWIVSWGLTQLNGAQVDVQGLRTQFFSPRLEILKVQWTQPDLPTRNRLELDRLELVLSGDALLRGKLVIESAQVTGLTGGGLRAKPGRVYPAIASNPDTPTGKLWVKAKEEAAQILRGFDPNAKFGKIGDLGQLSSLKQMAELQNSIATKNAEWQGALKQIPGEQQIAALQARVSGLAIGGNPAQIEGQIREASKLVAETQALVQTVQQKGAALQADVTQFSQSTAAIPQWIAQDQRELESRLKIPSLDAASLSRQIMGPRILGVLQLLEPYLHSSKKADGSAVPRKGDRLTGRIYEFGGRKSLPGFWLKQGRVVGALGAGDVEALVTDLSSQPDWVAGRPTIDFRARKFPLEALALVQTEDLKLAIQRAQTNGEVTARFAGSSLDIRGELRLTDTFYEVAAKPAVLDDILKGATARLAQARFGLTIGGTWDAPEIRLSSSLGDAIAGALRSRVDAQVAQVRAEIARKLNAQVDSKRKEVTAQVGSAVDGVTSQVSSRQKQAQGLQAQAEAKVAQAQSQLSRSATEGLRRKLPF